MLKIVIIIRVLCVRMMIYILYWMDCCVFMIFFFFFFFRYHVYICIYVVLQKASTKIGSPIESPS